MDKVEQAIEETQKNEMKKGTSKNEITNLHGTKNFKSIYQYYGKVFGPKGHGLVFECFEKPKGISRPRFRLPSK